MEDCFNICLEYFSMAVLVIMTVIVPWVVFSRYVLNNTPAWGEEGALLCMVWFGFTSMALGVRDNLHISIDIFDRLLPSSVKYWTDWLKRLIILGFGFFMLIEGITMSEVALGNDMPGIGLNSAFLYAAVPLGGLAIIYYTVADAIRTVLGAKGDKR